MGAWTKETDAKFACTKAYVLTVEMPFCKKICFCTNSISCTLKHLIKQAIIIYFSYLSHTKINQSEIKGGLATNLF